MFDTHRPRTERRLDARLLLRVPELAAEPSATLPILTALHNDPSEYVRRSVANHLNDLSRVDRALVICTARRWLADPAPSFAARFAAKEAFQKVWPRPHGWRDVWVERERTPDGPFPFSPPVLGFCPEIAAELEARGWTAHLTLTHTKEHASAVVVLEERR